MASVFYNLFAGAVMLTVVTLFLVVVCHEFLVAIFHSNKEKRADEKKKEFRKDWANTHCPNCGKRSKLGKPHPWPCKWYSIPEEDDDA